MILRFITITGYTLNQPRALAYRAASSRVPQVGVPLPEELWTALNSGSDVWHCAQSGKLTGALAIRVTGLRHGDAVDHLCGQPYFSVPPEVKLILHVKALSINHIDSIDYLASAKAPS